MLGDDDDVFDSVTWESPAPAATYNNGHVSSGPGFRQSTTDSNEGPLDPKWEGYLITSVKDPVKELAETKDAYVSYLVQAKHVHMHQHIAHPPGPEPSPSIIDNISDTLLNAFARVRKPDERFLDMREGVDKFEEGLTLSERLYTRIRGRTSVAVQGLGFLESGITDQLNHFSNTLLEFSALLRHTTQTTTDPLLLHLHSLLSYSHANRAVLKLRDQKQLDFEELSDYLSGVTSERDRLAAVISGHAGSTGLGLGAYIKDRVDAIRGADDDRSRVEKMRKLDIKIKELQDAVTTAHDTSDAFSDETLREQSVFQFAKEAEMKDMLGNLADGQIEFYKAAMEEWERIIPIIQRIRVDV
ncbi:hypothetical protein C0995_004216 [Termitomyces sp. Mi166|nr:hypothetical protein C0995_004216 [Termitomyces sp. Mi166\